MLLKYCSAIFAVMCLLSSCRHNPADVSLPQPARVGYLRNGWIPLGIPDSKIRPGSIVKIDVKGNVSYLSHLNTCGVPDSELKFVKGTLPATTYKEENKYGAKAVLTLKGVDSGPDFSRVARVELKQEEQSATALDVLALKLYLATHKLGAECEQFLNAPDIYVARESYEVAKGSYTLYDQNSLKLNVPQIKIHPFIITPDAHVEFTTDGSLEFNQPVYTAIRKLQRVQGDWAALGTEADDNKIDREIIQRLAPQ